MKADHEHSSETRGRAGPPPKVSVIVGGGTLTALAENPFEVCDYGQAGSLTARQLIERCAAMHDRVDLVPLEFDPVPSFDVALPQWLALCQLCEAALASMPDLAGFVLTHGTGSLEETAFFLSRVWDLPVPLVVTGAQRPASALGSDGYMNFHQAACVAANAAASGFGVLVVTHGEIHLPAEVTKTSTFGLDSFRSPDLGPVGLVTGSTVVFGRSLPAAGPRVLADWRKLTGLPRVDILFCHSGGDTIAIEAFIAAKAAGIVLAGFAPGYATGAQARRLERWVRDEGGLVVAAARATGPVVRNSRNDGHGFLAAGRHTPQKARLLVQIALAAGLKPSQIADLLR
ncbi:asparaginase [Frigidibacter mobilis]|uniref:Asparaginase n=1 Tax=Frigidibacter mobilis TaxID=1335048 RepID=A0A159Z3B6_9RHOB|nr:asparaginase [Frigidibacter mobilis]AMY69511.1 asparaginase [Frigidibacter mobilis]